MWKTPARVLRGEQEIEPPQCRVAIALVAGETVGPSEKLDLRPRVAVVEAGVRLLAVAKQLLRFCRAEYAPWVLIFAPAAVGALVEKQILGDGMHIVCGESRVITSVVSILPVMDPIGETRQRQRRRSGGGGCNS